MNSIHAIFENGVFKPIGPIELPDKCEVVFEPQVIQSGKEKASLNDVYVILGKRFDSGQKDVAERHDDHQP